MNYIDGFRSVRESNRFDWLRILESIKMPTSIVEREENMSEKREERILRRGKSREFQRRRERG